MVDEQKRCPFCGEEAQYGQSGHSEIYRYEGCDCGAYYAHDTELPMADDDIKAGKYSHLPALLYERTLKGLPAPLLVFIQSNLPSARKNIDFAEPIFVGDLLAQWPDTVPEQIERAFCNLMRAHKDKCPGQVLEVHRRKDLHMFFAFNLETLDYYIKAMKKYEWAKCGGVDERSPDLVLLQITPEGWARFDELDRGRSNVKNPAFVAMWFGGKERREEMSKLFDDAFKPAVQKAGYRVKRADTDEHNDPIMDRVIEDIRRAPFVVAELSDDNNGVYYEAGFAKGRGIEVIYCCRDGHKPHFDVTGINLVMWKDEDDLRKRLEDRILGSQSRGPYDFSTVPAS